MKYFKKSVPQKGSAHILILLAAVGLIVFLLTSSTFPFKDKLFGSLYPKPASHAQESTPSSPDEILLRFKPGASQKVQSQILSKHGLTVKEEIKQIEVKVVNVTPQARDQVIQALSHNPAIDFAEVNGTYKAQLTPNDPYFGQQWGMTKVSAPQAWDITQGSSSVKIAVLDTGIQESHPDLVGKVVLDKNFSSSSTVDDINGHGTMTAGIAAAITNNATGVAGLGFNSSLINGKVLGDDSFGYWSWIASGITWATDNGAKVINMSLGGTSGSSTLESAVNYAWNKGLVVAAAAGNNGSSSPFYPAYYTNAIAVAATDQNDQKASWSNYGDWVDVAAPGVNIASTSNNNTYGGGSGTSAASPHVAGLAGLVFTKVTDTNGNGLLNDEVRNCIQNNADNIGVSGIGSGRINAYKAVSCQLPPPTPDTTAPTVSITSPTNGSTVSGGVTVSVSASDNVGVTKVELYVDGTLFATDNNSPYSFFWDTTTYTNTTHALSSKAYDAAGNVGTSSTITVTVNNPISTPTPTPAPTATPTPTPIDTIAPTVSVTSPLNGATVTGVVKISATATDNVKVSSMQVYIDGKLKASSTTGSISTNWNTRNISSGSHTIQVKASDPSNNIGSSTITVTK